MTIYSIITSAGYYVERRAVPPTVMFAVLLALAVAATIALIGTFA